MGIESEIQNFYEGLVSEEIYRLLDEGKILEDLAGDVACVALNNLPSKYYRHSVDLAFYQGAEEVKEMRKRVVDEVSSAIEFVQQHRK